MPPSQLKRLKASLREQGLVGPQKSKKQKKSGRDQSVDQRLQKQAALQQIRDSFNPFEIKAPARNAKFAHAADRNGPATVGRPGVTKSMGEKTRRQNLLPELQRRNKSGGIVDRRIGEDDATMTPEEKALQRYMRGEGKRKRDNVFDLEGDDQEQTGLTHLGKALDLENGFGGVDDFDEALTGSEDESDAEKGLLKRRRPSETDLDGDQEGGSDMDDDNQPARKKSKQEVMKEVMAKSKLYKYERQKAKEDDDDLRAKLDSGMADLMPLLFTNRKIDPPKQDDTIRPAEPQMNADRLAMLQGVPREQADKEYDSRLRQLALDKRAAPADRTKTDEERAKDEAERLKELEQSRQRRMRGEESEESGDEREKAAKAVAGEDLQHEDEERDDAAEFGFTAPAGKEKMPVLDDEDEFELDEDLVASGSDLESGSEMDDSEDEDLQTNGVHAPDEADEEDEFVKGILDDELKTTTDSGNATNSSVAYTYSCPRNHEELLNIFKTVNFDDVPTVIQRIRALYHPSLSADNKAKLSDFSRALVDHISYMGSNSQPLAIVENIIRHLHSLSRTFPLEIAEAFRAHLGVIHKTGDIKKGDLVILTAIGSIYPTSDHFHQVVTPAITLIAKWLAFVTPSSEEQLQTGAFLVALSLHYQRLSKRYIPEALRFTIKALQLDAPSSSDVRQSHVSNLLAMAEQYRHLPAFAEIFTPAAHKALRAIDAKAAKHIDIFLSQARLARRPLELHHHRPLPIRTSIPKFEENFMPGKHYDPDKERSDAAKLRKEYKRERKGAIRELRKDSHFIAREQLREKKEKDAAYEKKFRRLVAEINSEEGREGNQYAREKDKRKRAK
ncbi:nucleolar protein 14 [Elsinoe ampelina]|uniref:Nucleolar protein 14 n=1 Tax=Elsinoe ampelina TaxID=302913 RepID=A0A6A6G7X7_9PEZI|nr:nucleolar protein 14 [Elsinoe ampelina]